ncbi:hypothetical protein PSN_2219 [Pseudomonas sp. NGC7]
MLRKGPDAHGIAVVLLASSQHKAAPTGVLCRSDAQQQ